MNEITRLVDVSVWQGAWPFQHLRYADLSLMEARLIKLGVGRAYIAPLGAVFEQSPHDANARMMAALAGRTLFSPMPVLHLGLADWREELRRAAEVWGARMVRILPEHHVYDLTEKVLEALVAETTGQGMTVSVPLRLEDPRGQYPLLKIKGLDAVRVAKVLSRFPEQPFIINNAYYPQEIDLFHAALEHVRFDIAMVRPVDPVGSLVRRYSARRFLFASHCPLFYPEGNVQKIRCADVAQADADAIAFGNAERLLAHT
jgi:uncharacterized protein